MTDMIKSIQESYRELPLPSDFLLDNYKTLQRRNDFEDISEDLDNLQHEAMQISFQDGFQQGELNILKQFLEGELDKENISKIFGKELGDI